MSTIVRWISNLKPLYKGFLGVGLGILVYGLLKWIIVSANKDSIKIQENKKNRKLTEIDRLKELTGEE